MRINKVQPCSDASGILDLLRFLSALTVLELHTTLRHIIPGYQAVMVFFVLSGYFVGSSVLKNVLQGKWTWSTYLTNRLVRLWIVLIPALFLTYVWVQLQNHLTPQTIHHDNLISFVKNALFLKGEFTPSFGHNGALWSLTYEFWYYMLFPPLILILLSKGFKRRSFYLIVTLGLSLFIYHVLGPRILKYFSIWVMGAMVAVIPPTYLQSKIMRRLVITASFGIAIASLWVPDALIHYIPTSSVNSEPYSSDFVIGLSFSLFIYLIISFYKTSTAFTKMSQIATYFAGFSYTLYLIHFPVLNFIRASHKSHAIPFLKHFEPSRDVLDNILFIIIILGYAWIISRLTEQHTKSLRDIVYKVISVPARLFNYNTTQNS